MSTTTERLSPEFKAQIAKAGQRADFDAVAEARFANIAVTGKSVPWKEMRSYLEDRVAGKLAKSPTARKLAR